MCTAYMLSQNNFISYFIYKWFAGHIAYEAAANAAEAQLM